VTPVLKDIIQSPSFQFSRTKFTMLRGKMGESLDKLSIIYHSTKSEVKAPTAEMASQARGTGCVDIPKYW
jgi:hypothetical protein